MEDQNSSQNPEIQRLADLYLKELKSDGAQDAARRYIEAYDKGEIAARNLEEDPQIQAEVQSINEKCYLATKLALAHIENKDTATPLNSEVQKLTDVVGNQEGASNAWEQSEEIDHKEFRDITSMNWEALKSSETIGMISPPTEGCFIISLRRPLSNGSSTIKDSNEQGTMVPFIEDSEFTPSSQDISITVPAKMVAKTFPIPFGYDIAGCDDEEGIYISERSAQAPLIVNNLDTISGKKITYVIRPSEPIKADIGELRPTPEEQIYWGKVLPLPPEILQMCKDNPHSIPSVIANFVRTNYRYVCNDGYGKFLTENKNDLPLIIDELKAGHCDILSWVSAAYFRQMGIPAVITTDLVTAKDGAGFMKSYGHARVVIVSTEGDIFFFDPAAYAAFDSTLNPDIFPSKNFEELSRRYKAAGSESEKREVLRQFNQAFRSDQHEAAEVHIARFAGWGGTNFSVDNDQSSESKFQRVEVPRRLVDPNIDQGFVKEIDRDIDLNKLVDIINDCIIDGAGLEDLSQSQVGEAIRGLAQFPQSVTYSERLNLIRLYNYFSRRNIPFGDPLELIYITNYYDAVAQNNYDFTIRGVLGYLFGGYTETAHDLDPKLYASAIGNFHDTQDIFNFLTGEATDVMKVDQANLEDTDFNMAPNFSNLKYIVPAPIDFKFTPEFKKLLSARLNMVNLGIQSLEEVIKNAESRKIEFSWEAMILVALLTQSLVDSKIKRKLMKDFKLDEQFFEKVVEALQGIKNGKPKAQISDCKLAIAGAEAKRAMKAKPNTKFFDRKLYARYFYAEGKEKAQVVHNAYELAKKAAPKNYAKRLENGSWTLAEYDPTIHDAKDIAWLISAKAQKVIVKQPELAAVKSEPVYVYIDTDCPDGQEPVLYESLVNTIEGLKKFSRTNKCEIFLSTNGKSNYFKLEQAHPAQVLANLLMITEDQHEDFRVVHKGRRVLPKNLIYLSSWEGKVAAVKSQLKKDVHAHTFKEAGLRVCPKIKESLALDTPMFTSESAT